MHTKTAEEHVHRDNDQTALISQKRLQPHTKRTPYLHTEDVQSTITHRGPRGTNKQQHCLLSQKINKQK